MGESQCSMLENQRFEKKVVFLVPKSQRFLPKRGIFLAKISHITLMIEINIKQNY